MKKKLALFALLPALAFVLLSVGTASAHGWLGMGNATPEEIAEHKNAMFQHKADLLGLSVDQVKDAWVQGKTLQELAEENGITEDQLKERMQQHHQEQMQAHLQTLVDQGVITQAQADQRLQVLTERTENRGFGKGFHRGGFGFF